MNKIAIMGAGAVGSYLGAFLTRAGEDITLIDMWDKNVAAIKKDGITVTGSQGPFTQSAKALHLHEVQHENRLFDIVLLAVKSYDTLWATEFIKAHLAPDGFVVSCQNGINDYAVASIVGQHRTLGCVMSVIEVGLLDSGHGTRGGPPGRNRGHYVFRVGELCGPISPRVTRIVQLLEHIDAARGTSNLLGERWAKLAANCMSNPTGAMSGLGSNGQAINADARRLRIYTINEVVTIAKSHDIAIAPVMGTSPDTWLNVADVSVYQKLDAKFSIAGPVDWHASMGQDISKGRKTENDFFSLYVSRRGSEVGIDTPISDATWKMMRKIERKQLLPNPTHIVSVLEKSGILRENN